MRLRDHPFVTYLGYSMWPPIWIGTGLSGQVLQGERGRLEEVRRYPDKPALLFLAINYAGAQYTGCLLFDEPVYCERIAELLRSCYGMAVKEIGDIDIRLPVDLLRAYRKASGTQTWHCCGNCSHWPQDDYIEEMMLPAVVSLCNECKSLQAERNCQ